MYVKVPTKNSTSPFELQTFGLCSALMVLEQVNDPRSRHGTSVFAVSSDSPPRTSRLGVLRIQ